MTRLPQSCERHQRYSFHIIYRYLQGLDNDLMVIIIACTASGTMSMIERCTRCVNQGRLMDVEIAGFIKHWGWKGGIEVRRRGVVDKLQNLAHTDNRALQQIYHDGHTISAQLTDLFIVYQCQCDRALCATVFWKYNRT